MTTKTLTAPDEFTGRIRGNAVIYRITKDGTEYDVFCGRCGGSGNVGIYYVEDGVCFRCNGLEGEMGSISVEKANQLFTNQDRAAAKREAKRLAVCAERDARVTRLQAAHPEVAVVLQDAYDSYQTGAHINSFHLSLAEQVFNAKGRDLSENQIAAVERGLAKKAEAQANAVPVVEGRGQITGVITSIKTVESDFGVATKVTIQDDRGFRVYGTLASSLVDEIHDMWYKETIEDGGASQYDFGPDVWFEKAKGTRVTFAAAVEASRDDKGFGFFKRPTKATVVA